MTDISLPAPRTVILLTAILAGFAIFLSLLAGAEDVKVLWTFTVTLLCGVAMMVFFLVAPLETTLVYFVLFPTLQVFNAFRITPGNTTAAFSFSGIILIVVLVFGGLACLSGPSRAYRKARGLMIVFGLYCLWLTVGIIKSAGTLDLMQAFKELGRIAGIFVYFLIGLRYSQGRRDVKRLIIAYSIGLVIPAAVAVYQIFTGTKYLDLAEHYNRIMGTFGIPNMFGMYLIWPLIMLLVFVLNHKRPDLQRLTSAAALIVLLITLFFTYTRASWLAFIIGALLIGALKYRRVIPLSIIGVIIMLSLFSLESLRLGSSGSSGRLYLWEKLFPVGFTKPILGHGLTSMTVVSKQVFGTINGGQNEFLLNFIETGLVGLILYGILIILLYRHFHRCYRALQGSVEEDVYLGMCAVVMAILSIAMFESNAVFQFWVWFPAGIMLGAYYNNPTDFSYQQTSPTNPILQA